MLKFPFSWEERRPLLQDGVFYIPKFYSSHGAGFLLQDIGKGFQQCCIEYCSGNGDWVIEKSRQEPHVLWIAVEKRFDRVRKIWSKRENLKIENLLIICGDALTFTQYYIDTGYVEKIFINFPDPWPKEKHAKNRLLQEPFVQHMHRVIKGEGEVIVVTDDVLYRERVIEEMIKTKLWTSKFVNPSFREDWPAYGESYFDALWRGQGRSIYYMKFGRVT